MPRSVLITAEEIEASGASTAWEALQAIVPLVTFQGTERRGKGDSRGPMRIGRRGRSSILLRDDPRVFLDHVRLVDITVLDQIPARDLWSIEILGGIEATTYYGTGATNGVVLIRTQGSVAPQSKDDP